MRQDEGQPMRIHAREVMLAELPKENGMVAVLGRIVSVDKTANEAVLSDENAEAKLVFQDKAKLDSLDRKELCRVIGKTVFNSNLPTINVETIQSMKGFNPDLWKKTRETEVGTND